MKCNIPDVMQSMSVVVDGQPAIFRYLIAPVDKEAGFFQPYVEYADVTDFNGETIEVSDDYIDEFINAVFSQEEEP